MEDSTSNEAAHARQITKQATPPELGSTVCLKNNKKLLLQCSLKKTSISRQYRSYFINLVQFRYATVIFAVYAARQVNDQQR